MDRYLLSSEEGLLFKGERPHNIIKMLLIAPLLLAIMATVNTKAFKWTQQLPKDLVLINKDQLSLPIDEFVSLSGAIFTATDPTKNVIIPKIQVTKEAISSQGSNMNGCQLADNSKDGFAIFVCSKYIIRIEKDDNFMLSDGSDSKSSKSVTLVTPKDSTPALKDTSTFCTDIFSQNGKFFINCYDTSATSNPNFIFSLSEGLDATQMTIGTCKTGDLKGDSKMIRLLTQSSSKNAVVFIDVSKTSNTNSGTISLPYCSVDNSNAFGENPGAQNNLFSIINNQELSKGVLRYVASWSATDLLAFIAVDDGTTKALHFVPLTISDTGAITLNTNKAATKWTGANIEGFNPNYMTFAKTSASNTYVASDKANLYTFAFDSTTMALKEKDAVWNTTLDCGFSGNSAIYISRIEVNGGNGDLTNPGSRTLIVYSNSESKKTAEFAIHINNTKYACSKATTAIDTSKLSVVNTVSFTSDTSLITTADSKLSKSKINYNTMLQITISEETADKSVDISAKMDGWDAVPAQKFEYKSLKSALDFNSVNIGTKTFKTYAGSSSYLSIPSFSFKGNNPTISTTNPNVKLRYTSNPTVALTGLQISDYDIHRIFAVDDDSFVATLRKSGSAEAFIRFWNKWDGSKNTLVVNNTLKTLADRQMVFKIFKLGPNIMCLIFKANGGSSKKLTLSCFNDKADSQDEIAEVKNREITDRFEVSDIQILESDSRVDMFMIGTASSVKDGGVLHYYLSVGSDGKISFPEASYVAIIDITSTNLENYYPTDISYDVWGDSESTNYVTIKQVSKFNQKPVVSKYNVSVGTSPTSPPTLTYLYHMYIPSQDLAFCAIKNEIIFFSQKTKQILVNKMIRVPTGITLPQNKLYLPVSEFGINYIQQFNCIPEKGIFQILGVDSTKNKFLINFRGGDSTNGARRVHSVIKVAATSTFLETAFNNDFIVSVVSTPGKIDVARNFVYTYFDGPKFIVDNTNAKESYDVAITSTTSSSASSTTTVRVEIVSPMYKAEVKARDQFQITEGKTIFLDQVSTINGPVMDIKVEGNDASKVKLIKRNNKHKGYNGGDSTTTADRVFADEDFMVLMWTGSKLKIMGDPALTKTTGTNPVEVLTESSINVKEAALIKYGALDNQAILVTRVYSDTTYKYSIYHLSRTAGKDANTYVYNYVKSENLYQTPSEFDSLQVATINDQTVVIALKMKRSFNSNYVRLVSFQKDTGNKFKYLASTIVPALDTTKEIGGHSLVWDGNSNVALVAFYKDTENFIYATWNGMTSTPNPTFRPSVTKVKFADSDLRSISANYLRCWTGSTKGTLDCIVDAQGVVDHLLTFTPEPTQKGELDPIMTITKSADFEMPPLFEIKRTDRGKEHYGFLLKRSPINVETAASRRLLQQTMALDAYKDCNNIIVFFKPSAGRYIYTGITCSEWGNNTNVDFAMEYETNEYIYITKFPKAPAPAPVVARRVLQTSENDRIGANYLAPIQVTVTGAVDPTQVKFTFIGLNGPNDPTINPAVTLNDFKQGAPPANTTTSSGSSFWTWFIIILVILLVIGGGIYGYIWYQNNQSSSSSTSSYTKQVDRDASKSDLEDTRL